MITHDLKAPLTSIVGFSSMLLEEALGPCPNIEFRNALSNIWSNGRKLTQLINDFLTFSRIEAGKLELQFEPLNLLIPTLQAISALKYQAEQKHVNMVLEPCEGVFPNILGDNAQIERAIGNVLSNALKYSPQDSQVTLRIRHQNNWLIVSIADQGPGIPPELLPRIFDRYFRGQAGGHLDGTGLGLSIVKSIVEAHGGTVQVESQPGRGTCFQLRFPVTSTPGSDDP